MSFPRCGILSDISCYGIRSYPEIPPCLAGEKQSRETRRNGWPSSYPPPKKKKNKTRISLHRKQF